jgi:hypothetical protein
MKGVGATAAFWGALAAQILVLALYLYHREDIGYLWYNPIGSLACMVFSPILQVLFAAVSLHKSSSPDE